MLFQVDSEFHDDVLLLTAVHEDTLKPWLENSEAAHLLGASREPDLIQVHHRAGHMLSALFCSVIRYQRGHEAEKRSLMLHADVLASV